jgi:3-methyladenine DNA glycosylase Tag
MDHTYAEKPTSLDGYLEVMSKVIFTAGINWKVVHAKWDGIRDAFGGFETAKVAELTPADVDRLAEDTRLIRNRKKIESIIDNAGTLLELENQPGGFAAQLASAGDFQAQVDYLKRTFRFLGPSSAHIFLAMVGESVPACANQAHFTYRE